MYLVKDTFLVLSMVGKAKAPEHKIKTSLLEYDELKNYYKDEDDKYKTIYLNKSMESVKLILLSVLTVFICILETFIILMMYLNNLYQHLILSQLLQNVINQIF
jgi:hypothetical protein